MVRLVPAAVAVTYRTTDAFKPSKLFPAWPPLFSLTSRWITLYFNTHNIKYLTLVVFYMFPVDIDDNRIIAGDLQHQRLDCKVYNVMLL